MQLMRSTRLGCGLVMAAALFGAPSATLAETTSKAAIWQATPNQADQWFQGATLLTAGRVEEGKALLDGFAASKLSMGEADRVRTWTDDYASIETDRLTRKSQDYKKYAQWAHEDIANQKALAAMRNCARAFNCATDEDKFRQEPWVQEATQAAVKAAREYEKNDKWYKAARIYFLLEAIFPLQTEYREASNRCQDHIRLELTYAKDSEWENAVRDITPMMAVEAFKRMASDYLREVNFQKVALAALDQVLMLTQEPKLSEVLTHLDNEDDVAEFRDRIQPWIKRAKGNSDLSLTDLVEILDRVLRINREIDLVPETALIREFVHGALQPLDQFSDMLWPADTSEFNKHTQGKFTGVGISIRKERGKPIKVITPLEDTPAYQAGIRPGDLITKINGKPAEPLSINRAVQIITGPPRTTVTLTIKRPGLKEEFDVRLERAEITIYSIKGYQRIQDGQWDFMVDPADGIAYMRMTNFTEETTRELTDTIKNLVDKQNARGLILDLRGNPGGLLKTAVEVASLFLNGDKEIVSTRDRLGQDTQAFTSEPQGDHYPDLPLILLVNGSSASASEIVAGALQDHGRALVVGERTFGKGSVQQVLPVAPNYEAVLKLTTARYYLPNGRCLHREEDSVTWGVDPDVEVKLVPKEMVKIANMRVKRDILKGRNQAELTDEELDKVFATQPADDDSTDDKDSADADEDDEEDVLRDDPNEWPEIDPQLQAALLLMRLRLETRHPWPLQVEHIAARTADSSGG